MTFVKRHADGVFNRSFSMIGLRWIGTAFAAMGLTGVMGMPEPPPEHDNLRYRKSKRHRQKMIHKPNRLHISKRVRRKHRRAA